MGTLLFCSACQSTDGVEMHHLVPRILGGNNGPLVPLCGKCHGLVHDIDRPINLGSLIKAGIERRKAAGLWKKPKGSPKGRLAYNPSYFANNPDAGRKGAEIIKANAVLFAEDVERLIKRMLDEGVFKLNKQLLWLNTNGYRSYRGEPWNEDTWRKAKTRTKILLSLYREQGQVCESCA